MKFLNISNKAKLIFIGGSAAVFVVVVTITIVFSIAPTPWPERQIVSIAPGTYLSQVAQILEEKGVIKSSFIFKVYVALISGHRQVQAGDYLFDSAQTALKVADRMANGIQGLPKVKVTIVEGMTVASIGKTIKKVVPAFDERLFDIIAKPYEGYLYPDTYFFYENAKPQQVVDALTGNFSTKLKPYLLDLQAFGHSAVDVVKMASIVEKEANASEDRRVIAGILWKRLDAGMPLQVDVPFFYVLEKKNADLTKSDLAIDSPYNLYKHKGLTPTPISNPSISAILDVINPTKSKYWFYLAGKDGKTHYAETHDGHISNIRRYL